jgi:olfactory receptor
MLQNFPVAEKSISFGGFIMQFWIYAIFATCDCYLLVVMAVDHYVAICGLLHYLVIMSQKVCIQMVAGSYFIGSINSSVHTGFTFSLFFCKSNHINQFYYDVSPIITLSCSNIDISIMLFLVFM